MTEKEVQRCVEKWLREDGYKVTVQQRRSRRLRNVDIVARNENHQQWIIEVKGCRARPQGNRNALKEGIAQLVLCVERVPVNPAARHGLAVPDTMEWRRLVCQIPGWFRETIRLHIILVKRNCGITVITPAQSM